MYNRRTHGRGAVADLAVMGRNPYPEYALVQDASESDDYTLADPAMIELDDTDDGAYAKNLAGPFHYLNKLLQLVLPGFMLVLLLAAFGLIVVALVWICLLEFTDIGGIISSSRNFIAVFNLADFIIAFMYRQWLTQSLELYEVAPRQLQELLERVLLLSNTYYKYLIPNNPLVHAHGMEQNAYNLCIAHPADLLVAMNERALCMFMPFEDEQRSQASEYLQERLQVQGAPVNGDGDVLDRLADSFDRIVREQHALGTFEGEGRSQMSTIILSIKNSLAQYRQASRIRSPPVSRDILVFVMAVYMVAIIPVTQYSAVGVYMAIMYPFTVMLVFGSIFMTWFIKGPFSSHARFRGMAFYEWRSVNYVHMRQHEREASTRWWASIEYVREHGQVLDGSDKSLCASWILDEREQRRLQHVVDMQVRRYVSDALARSTKRRRYATLRAAVESDRSRQPDGYEAQERADDNDAVLEIGE